MFIVRSSENNRVAVADLTRYATLQGLTNKCWHQEIQLQEQAYFGKYFVIMMDLLGQKEMYQKLEQHPIQNTPEFKGLLTQFIKQIEFFKKDVDSFLSALENAQTPNEYPEEYSEIVAQYRKKIYRVQRFSDGIMLYVPLACNESALPIFSVYSAITCAGSTMLMSLARGNPIRVGIAIGGGIELEDGELFGPAIGHAHTMESQRAIYPRIALHENVLDYLLAYEQLHHSKDLKEKLQARMASVLKSMLVKDHDNEVIFDYLGSVAWQTCYGVSENKLLNPALSFIREQHFTFEDQKNDKLAAKYSYVLDYFTNSGLIDKNGA